MSVAKLSEQLTRAGCIITVFTTTANGQSELAVQSNQQVIVDDVPVIYFNRLTKDHSHFSPALLAAVWKQAKQFDAVHIHAWWNLVSVLSCLIALIHRVPVIVSPRGMLSLYSFNNKNVFYKRCIHYLLGKPLLNKCSIHITSDHEKISVSQLTKPKHIFNISNFVKLPPHQPVKKVDPGNKLRLLFLSRIHEKKGLDILLNALTDVTIPYHLTIAGSGDETYVNSLKQLAAQNNLTPNISWIGFQKENKFEVLNDHDLMVLPSYDENFGNVVIESLCVGTAVLISEYVGLANYVKKNELGWICNTNPRSVADSINNIDTLQLANIKANAPRVIENDFNDDHLVQLYIGMYQNLLLHE